MSEYLRLISTPSDIYQHMPTFHKYAQNCKHVTEMGVREIISIWSWLEAKVPVIRAYDLLDPPVNRLKAVEEFAIDNHLDFKFFKADVLKIEIEPTELLFIDTWHVADQLRQELALHSSKVSKYLMFHDTTTFGLIGEGGQYKGLSFALNEFLLDTDDWRIKEVYTNNNGLTILERI